MGRSPSHRRAMLRNLASSLFLTERDADEFDDNAPEIKGRVVTTLHKAKEVRPLVEKCITIARHSLRHEEAADAYSTGAERGSEEWKSWRSSEQWRQWCDARAPAVAARRHALRLLGDKEAVRVLFEEVAPRFADRDGGYTRVLKLATPRLGDAGARAILEFVGTHDRVTLRSERPAFTDEDTSTDEASADDPPADDVDGIDPDSGDTPADDESVASDQSESAGGEVDDAEATASTEDENGPSDKKTED